MPNDRTVSGGTLYLIPVPLSTDTPPSATLPSSVLETVKRLKCFFVENERSARRFLKAVDRSINIDELRFYVLDEHITRLEASELAMPLKQAGEAGMISEAGCPGVADPGAFLVEVAREIGFDVVPMVGPSSILLGLMASGFNGQNFAFNGYLPRETEPLRRKIKELWHRVVSENQTQIFIETPYRNLKLLEELKSVLPSQARLCVAVELTSPGETVVVLPVEQWRRRQPVELAKRPAIFLIYK